MSNDFDRYVTWGLFVPDGVPPFNPSLDPFSLPTWFPNPDEFFPKDVQPMYAIRNTAGAVTAMGVDGLPVTVPAVGWWLYSWGVYSYAEDPYFSGGVPDDSFGTAYPPEAMRHYEVVPPDWVLNGGIPPGQEPPPPPPPPPVEQPDPGGGGMTPPDGTVPVTDGATGPPPAPEAAPEPETPTPTEPTPESAA